MAFSNHDIVFDSPTNNFATLNSTIGSLTGTMADGNLKYTIRSGHDGIGSNFYVSSGKYYWETYFVSSGDGLFVGISSIDEPLYDTGNIGNYAYKNTIRYWSGSGNIYYWNGTASSNVPYGNSFAPLDIIGVFLNLDDNELYFYKNGSVQNNGTPINIDSSTYDLGTLTIRARYEDGGQTSNPSSVFVANFGQDPTFGGAKVPTKVYTDANGIGRFFHEPPTGALALCTANLATATTAPTEYIVDETNQHLLTYNGNVTQSKFTPYASNGYSLYNTETSGISFGSNSDFNFLHDGTTSYTISGWIYRTGSTGSAELLLDTSNFGSGNVGIYCAIGSNNLLNFQINRGQSGSATAYLETNYSVPLNQWTYFSILHDSTITSGNTRLKVYVNGVETGYNNRTYSYNNSSSNSNRALYLGVYNGSTLGFTGYLADVRIIQNVDAANYTVPTSNVSSTGTNFLLSTLSKQFVDSSSNNYPITLTGSPEISDWSPYTPEAVRTGYEYRNPDEHGGGSFYFDGTNNLKTIDSTDWNPEAQDFTVEGWYYLTETGSGYFMWGTGGSDGSEDFAMRVNTNNSIGAYLRNSAGTLSTMGSTNTVSKNSWNHIALERYNNVIKIYLNGVAETNTFDATSWSGYNSETGMTIGAFGDYSGLYWKGYIADFRIVKGSAVYQGNFTPPNAKLSTVTDTKLLLQPYKSKITKDILNYASDETGKALTYVGNASVVNTSPYKDGVLGGFNSKEAGNAISTVNHSDFNFGTDPFTMEAWIKRESGTTNTRAIFNKGDRSTNSSNTNEFCWFITSTEFQIHYPGVIGVSGGSDLSGVNIYDWMHVVWERVSGGGINFYVNGIKTSSHTYNFNLDSTLNFEIGGSVSGNDTGVGLYSDVRIVKGQALYGGTNFISPAYPLSSTHYTTNGQDPSDSNSTRTAITGTVSLLAQPGRFIENTAEADNTDNFKAVTYTGQTDGGDMTWNGTTGTVNVGFQPDFVWLKGRSYAEHHHLYDVVRGATQVLYSNRTVSEATDTLGLTSFDADGFSIGSRHEINNSGDTFVAWCWKAAGAPADNQAKIINEDGTQADTTCAALASAAGASITPSKVSANRQNGFSIVKYEGVSPTTSSTLPHGLSKTPEIVIIKGLSGSGTTSTGGSFNMSSGSGWLVNHVSTGLEYSRLDTTAASATYTNMFKGVGSSYITIGIDSWLNCSGVDYIMYCWHSVEGYSKFGWYASNNADDGNFVYLGFRPSFVMIKSTGGSSNSNYWSWTIYDNARNDYNPAHSPLYANLSAQENYRGDGTTSSGGDTLYLDFLSNGFKIRNSGTEINGATTNYIFMAFAEQPFIYSNAR